MNFLIAYVILIYIVGMFFYINMITTDKIDFHKGGFLNMGYTSTTHKKTTQKNALLSLVWPIFAFQQVVIVLLVILNIPIEFLCLLFNYKFEETRYYKWVDSL